MANDDLKQRLDDLQARRRELEPEHTRSARAALTANDLERVTAARLLAQSYLEAFSALQPAPEAMRRLEFALDDLDEQLRNSIRPIEAELGRFSLSVQTQARAAAEIARS